MSSRDYDKIFGFNDDYVDSPAALVMILKAMAAAKADEIKILRHINSSAYFSTPIDNTTSYFTILFGENQGIDQPASDNFPKSCFFVIIKK